VPSASATDAARVVTSGQWVTQPCRAQPSSRDIPGFRNPLLSKGLQFKSHSSPSEAAFLQTVLSKAPRRCRLASMVRSLRRGTSDTTLTFLDRYRKTSCAYAGRGFNASQSLDVQLEIDTLRTVDDNRQGWLLKPLRRSWTEEQEKAAKANNCPLSKLMNPYRSRIGVDSSPRCLSLHPRRVRAVGVAILTRALGHSWRRWRIGT
jgi:hypothetical protein